MSTGNQNSPINTKSSPNTHSRLEHLFFFLILAFLLTVSADFYVVMSLHQNQENALNATTWHRDQVQELTKLTQSLKLTGDIDEITKNEMRIATSIAKIAQANQKQTEFSTQAPKELEKVHLDLQTLLEKQKELAIALKKTPAENAAVPFNAISQSHNKTINIIQSQIEQWLKQDVAIAFEFARQFSWLNLIHGILTISLFILVAVGGYYGRKLLHRMHSDSQKRQEALLELQQAETMASTILQSALDSIIVINHEGMITRFNRASEKLFGYSSEEILGQNVKRLMPAPHHDNHDSYLAKYIKTGIPHIIGLTREVSGLRKDGSEFPMRLSVSEMRVNGKQFFTGIVQDLSAVKETLQVLHRQALVFDNITDAVILTDLRNRIIDWNPGAYRIFGYSKEEAIGKTTDLLTQERNHLLTTRIFTSVFKDGRWEGELPFIRKDGSRGISDTVVVPLYDESGKRIATVGVYQDVTDKRQAEEQLRESELRYRQLTQAARDVISRHTIHSQFIDVSPACQRILGYSQDELIGKKLYDLVHPSDISDLRNSYAALLQKRTAEPVSFRIRGQKGNYIWVETSNQLVEDSETGATLEIVTVTRDISDRRETEQRLRLQYTITQVLTKSIGIEEAAPKILEGICQSLNWEMGELWTSSDKDRNIRLVASWCSHSERLDRFTAESRHLLFESGRGLPGHIWQTKKPLWIENIYQSDYFHPEGIAAKANLRGAIGFPIISQGEIQGVMIFFNRTMQKPNEPLLELISATGGQIGQFIQRRRAEQELRNTLSLQRAILDSANHSIITGRPDGIITTFNKAAERLLGYRSEEVIGIKTPEIIHDRDEVVERSRVLSEELGETVVPGFETFVTKARIKGSDENEWTYIRKDGSRFPVLLTVTAIRDQNNNITGYLGIGNDISERKQAEEDRQRFVALVEHVPDFIGMADMDGNAFYVNPAGRNLVGLKDINDVKTRKVNDFLPAESHKFMNEVTLPTVLAKGRWEGEMQLQNFTTGQIIETQQNMFVVYHPRTNLPMCLATVMQDITDRKKAQIDLERAKDQAESANRAKTHFLANMSHEIRTPIGAILGYADMLLDPNIERNEKTDALHSLRRNGSHLLQIINDILDLSRIEFGKLELEFIPYSPWQVVLEAISILAVRADEKGIHLKATPSGIVPDNILTDPTRLRQILVNFVGNAIKFTETGKNVELLFGCLASDTPDATLTFAVRDEGIGLTSEQRNQLFKPFQQADTSHTRKYGGTGLGLSICKHLAEAFEGTIEVESEFGKGSTFTLIIPVRPAESMTWISAENLSTNIRVDLIDTSKEPISCKGRILLAEDSKDNQRVIQYHLRKMGLEAEIAENGQIAVDRALHESFDLVLMDMQMPELDGYGATSALREEGYTKPIIALTAHAMRGDREKCLSAGCTEFLTKPVDPVKLAETLMQYLRTSESKESTETCRNNLENKFDKHKEPNNCGPMVSHFADDPEFLELIQEYVASLTPHIRQWREALYADEKERLASLAHQTKGAAGMYGYPELSDLAAELEMMAKSNETAEKISEKLSNVEQMVVAIEQGLNSHQS